jgi:hypothetical protein
MDDELKALKGKANDAHLAVEIAHDNALDYALKAGDVLLEIFRRDLVQHGQRKALYAETCGSKSTGEVYVRLASHRDLLVESRQTPSSAVRLSIRAALRIIDKGNLKPKRKAAKVVKTGEAPLPDFTSMTDRDWTRTLEALGIDHFLEVMPKDWRPLLGKRMLALVESKKPKPKPKKHRLATDIRFAIARPALSVH